MHVKVEFSLLFFVFTFVDKKNTQLVPVNVC